MADTDRPEIPLPPPAPAGAHCPWCSAPLTSPDEATCGVCGATLVGDSSIEIPGVTALDDEHASQAASPRRITRSFGSLFVGNDDEIPPFSEAELPALARPDADVRREMLRLRLDAELADLTARAAAQAAERGIPMPEAPGGGANQADTPDPASLPDAGAVEPRGADATPVPDAASPEENPRA